MQLASQQKKQASSQQVGTTKKQGATPKALRYTDNPVPVDPDRHGPYNIEFAAPSKERLDAAFSSYGRMPLLTKIETNFSGLYWNWYFNSGDKTNIDCNYNKTHSVSLD